jgi:hypothetical protein
MDGSKIAVATITWAQSPHDEQLLARSLGLLANHGLPVAVADRGTSISFGEVLRSLPNVSVTVPSEPGLVPQVQAALELAAAFGTRFILYVEPDKELFFGSRMAAFTESARDGQDAGVVIAARSAASFRTFPPMQQYTEGVINHLCGEMIGLPGDYSYGPFLLNRELVPHVSGIGSRLGWGWRHFAFLTAHRLGLRVLHITGDYPCPPDQRGEGAVDRAHRLRQLSQNILGLLD